MANRRMGFEQAGQQTHLGDVLWDLHAAGAKVLEYTFGRGWAEFEESELLQAFTAKMLGIVGDCLRELRLNFAEEYARVPGAEVLAEVTEATAPTALWRQVQQTLPRMVAEVHAMLAEWHGGGPATSRVAERAEDSQERAVEYDEARRIEYEE